MQDQSNIYKFCLKFIVFCALLIAIDFSFYFIRYPEKNVFFTAKDIKQEWISRRFKQDSETYDIAFIGSSLTQFGVDAKTIGDSLNQRVINLGLGGMRGLNKNYEMLRCAHEYFGVDTIVLGIESSNLNLELNNNGLASPDDAVTKNECALFIETATSSPPFPRDLNTLLSRSNIFKYGKNIPRYAQDLWHGNYEPPYKRGIIVNKSTMIEFSSLEIEPAGGWIKADGQLRPSRILHHSETWDPDPTSVAALDKIITYSKQNNIKLIVLEIPMYVGMRARQPRRFIEFENLMCQHTARSDFEFINLNTKAAFQIDNPTLFLDSNHLNKHGASALAEIIPTALTGAYKSCDKVLPDYQTLLLKGRIELLFDEKASPDEWGGALSALTFIGPYGRFDIVDLINGEGMPKSYMIGQDVVAGKKTFPLHNLLATDTGQLRKFSLSKKNSRLSVPFTMEAPLSWLADADKPTVHLNFSIANIAAFPVKFKIRVRGIGKDAFHETWKLNIDASSTQDFSIPLDRLLISAKSG